MADFGASLIGNLKDASDIQKQVDASSVAQAQANALNLQTGLKEATAPEEIGAQHLANLQKQLDYQNQLLGAAKGHPELWPQIRAQAVAVHPQADAVIPQQYDEGFLDYASRANMTAAQRIAEQQNLLENKRAAAVLGETVRHNKVDEGVASQNADTKLQLADLKSKQAEAGFSTNAALQSGLTGQDFLNTLDPGTAATVKYYGEGRGVVSPAMMRSNQGASLLNMINAAYPGFDAAKAPARAAAMKSFAPGGKNATTINALNTAIQHAGEVSDSVENLNNGNYPLLNKIENLAGQAAGGTKQTNFKTAVSTLIPEIVSAYRQGGGNEADLNRYFATLGDENASKPQQAQALNTVLTMMKGKVSALQDQYNDVKLGNDPALNVIYPDSQQAVDKVGVRAGGGIYNAPDPSASPRAAAQPAASAITSTSQAQQIKAAYKAGKLSKEQANAQLNALGGQ